MFVLLQNTGTVIISQEGVWLTVSVMHRTPKGNGPEILPSSVVSLKMALRLYRPLSAFLVTQKTKTNTTLAGRDISMCWNRHTHARLKGIFSAKQHSEVFFHCLQ